MNLAWTYDTLFEAMQAWPVDEDDRYLDNLPNILQLGQLRLIRDMNLEYFDQTDTSKSTAIGTRVVDKPDDLITEREVGIVVAGSYVGLDKRTKSYCKMYAPTAAQAQPLYWYEESETEIGVVPTPDAVYVVHQFGVYRPGDTLDEANQGPSWISRAIPDALFAACLMEAEQFLKADDRYNDYKTKYYEELLPTARLELRSAIRSGDYSPTRAAAETV